MFFLCIRSLHIDMVMELISHNVTNSCNFLTLSYKIGLLYGFICIEQVSTINCEKKQMMCLLIIGTF